MARIYPLFSSSKGNSTYVGNSNGGILIDAGVSCKRLCDAMASNELSPEKIHGIFVTHTHSDHISGLRVFLKKYKIPVYAQRTNLEIMCAGKVFSEGCQICEIDGNEICAGDFSVKSFETPHDTPASCGYRISTPDGKVAVVCTDLGGVTPVVRENLAGADLVLLESNYDVKMLENGIYPYPLKQRIASDHGHLSNPDCAVMLKNLLDNGTNKYILGHLSQENNTPLAAESSAVRGLCDAQRDRDYILHIARPDGNGMAVAF